MSSARENRLSRLRPTWAEVDVAVFAENVQQIKQSLPPNSELIAVLKADGYGHGAVELAGPAIRSGASMIAVALLEEAMELRSSGMTAPIFVLGPLTASQLHLAAENELTLGIVGPTQLAEAAQSKTPLQIQLKLDTGMGRMGLVESDLPEAATTLRQSPHLKLGGIYTHYASASSRNDPFTGQQRTRFRSMVAELKRLGLTAPLHHSANSPATISGLVEPGDYARVGMILYGGEVLDEGGSRLRPVMRWRTEIARIKDLPPGGGVGYGHTFRASRPSRIATLPVGYADGYSRLLSNRGEVLIRGKRAPVVGNISMDLVTVDVTQVPNAVVGDEVILLGPQDHDEISAEELARKTDTIAYEVFCRISARVPRVYLSGNRQTVKSRFLV